MIQILLSIKSEKRIGKTRFSLSFVFHYKRIMTRVVLALEETIG